MPVCDGQINSLLFVFNLGQTHFNRVYPGDENCRGCNFNLTILPYVYTYIEILNSRVSSKQRQRHVNDTEIPTRTAFLFFKTHEISDQKWRLVKITRINSPDYPTSKRFQTVSIHVHTFALPPFEFRVYIKIRRAESIL